MSSSNSSSPSYKTSRYSLTMPSFASCGNGASDKSTRESRLAVIFVLFIPENSFEFFRDKPRRAFDSMISKAHESRCWCLALGCALRFRCCSSTRARRSRARRPAARTSTWWSTASSPASASRRTTTTCWRSASTRSRRPRSTSCSSTSSTASSRRSAPLKCRYISQCSS